MKVRNLMSRHVKSCAPQDSLETAARLMWEHDIGCVVVVDGHRRPIGMITDRDVCMAAYTQGLPLREIHVEKVMARAPLCCRASDNALAAATTMGRHQVRRLPVTDETGVTIGVISLRDLSLACVAASGSIQDDGGITAPELAHTLAAVSAPRDGSSLLFSSLASTPALA